MTVKEVFMILEAHGKRVVQDFERDRILVHEQAVLNSYAWHNPRKMPKYKPRSGNGKVNEELAQAQVRGFFIGLATAGKG